MVKIKGDKPLEPVLGQEHASEPRRPGLDPKNLAALKSTMAALAPELFEAAAPKKDALVKEAPPTLFSADEEATASSVRPRATSATGLSAHALRAELCRSGGRKMHYDSEELEAMEYESAHKNDLEIDESVLAVEEPEEETPVDTAADDYVFDLIADQAKDNMENFVREADHRTFVRGEDLWHERYRHDAHSRQDGDEVEEHMRNAAADRASEERAADARRAADEAAARAAAERRADEARRAADDYARRLAEDRNRH